MFDYWAGQHNMESKEQTLKYPLYRKYLWSPQKRKKCGKIEGYLKKIGVWKLNIFVTLHRTTCNKNTPFCLPKKLDSAGGRGGPPVMKLESVPMSIPCACS